MATVLAENALVPVDGKWLTLKAILIDVSGGKRVLYIDENGKALKSESLSKSQFKQINVNDKNNKVPEDYGADSIISQKQQMYVQKNNRASLQKTHPDPVPASNLRHIVIADEEFTSNTGGSSRGYAGKAKIDNIWYKISAGSFNAQAEVVASRLAKYTNVGQCVEYGMCVVNGKFATMSKDFLSGKENETVKSLHAKLTGAPIEPMLEHLTGIELFKYVSSIVKTGIGLELSEPAVFSKLSLLLQFDALVMNEDRHFNNIKFIKRTGGWDFAPAFDFDCSLFSCVEDLSRLEQYPKPCLPFFTSHPEQLDWLYSISGDRLTISGFRVSDLTDGVWEESHRIGKREIEDYLASVLERAV